MLRTWMTRALPAAIAVGLAVLAACGTDAVGVETCRTIETARCRNAPRCQINLGVPVHRSGDVSTDIDACIRFYEDACLHGLAASDPGAPQAAKCVDAIDNGTCDVVDHPETAPACAWLIPPATPADAGSDSGAADAATEAAADSAPE